MKLVDINGRFLSQTMTGVQRSALELIQALDAQLTDKPELRRRFTFRLVTPAHQASVPLRHIPTLPVGRLQGHAWEQLELPIHTHGRLLLNLCNTAPLAVRTIATIYDASVFAVPEAYSPAFRLWYRTLLPLLGKRARLILTTSNFSREELIRRAGVPPEKIRVLPLGSEHVLRSPADRNIFSRVPVQPGRYILAVGSQSPHKNLAGVLHAVSQLGPSRLPLVVAGGANAKVFNQAPGLTGDSFHAAGYVSDSELRALYENAACFVYPSFYEGFGFPPLEAMTCGCPAVVSRTASLPEVCGDAVLYCNPSQPEDIARQIRWLLEDPERRTDFRERGLIRARSFTWERASSALLSVLEQVAAS